MNLQEMPGRGEAPVPATGPSLFTLPSNFVIIVSVVVIVVFTVFLELRRREI